jgi:hypothetical protein
MKAIEKIESFLQNFSWKMKLAIFLAFIFWAPQTFFPLINEIKNNYHPDVVEAVPASYIEEKQWNDELRKFANKIYVEAEKKGRNYNADDYFRDFRILEDFKNQYPFRYQMPLEIINPINKLFHENMRSNPAAGKEIEHARYRYHFQKENPDVPRAEVSFSEFLQNSGVLGWALTLYWRGLLLALLLYFIKMSQNRGILETVLADKQKLLLAIFLWPRFLLDYPGNAIRQIVIEAELRRLGGLWRKLDPRDRRLVKEIASRSKAEYRKWIVDYELKNAQRFKRSFEWALMATVLVILSQAALPVNANADMAKLRDGPCLEQGAVYDQYDTRSNDESSNTSPDNAPIWAEEIFVLPAPCFVERLGIIFEKLKRQEFARSVFKIPVDGYLVKGFYPTN